VRNAGWFGAASVFASLVSYVVDPLLSHALTPGAFGVVALCATVVGMLSATYALGLDSAANRLYFDAEADEPRRQRLVGTLQAFHLAWLAALTLLQELAGPWLYARLLPDVPYDPYGRLVAFTLLLGAASAVPRAVWTAREEVRPLVGWRIGGTLIGALLLWPLLTVWHLGPVAVLWSELVAALFLVPPSLRFVLRHFGLAFDRTLLLAALAFGVPMVVHLTSHWVLNAADRFVIEDLLGRDAVGLYSAAYKAIAAGITANLALNAAYVPQFMRAHGKPLEAPFVRDAILTLVGGSMAVALALSLLGPTVVRTFYHREFQPAAELIPLLAPGAVLQALYLVHVNALFWSKKTSGIPVWTTLAGAVNVALCYLLIPSFGLPGAAWATTLGYGVLALLFALAARKVTVLPWDGRRIAKLTAVAVVAWLLGLALDGKVALWVEWVGKVALAGGAAAVGVRYCQLTISAPGLDLRTK
jgi:O-antigen/teichoic acid export membrane protein